MTEEKKKEPPKRKKVILKSDDKTLPKRTSRKAIQDKIDEEAKGWGKDKS